MRLAEFLKELSWTPRTWYATPEGWLRCQDIDDGVIHCPISRVAQRITMQGYGQQYAQRLGREMGLRDDLIQRLYEAADNARFRGEPTYPTLRKRLIRACGLGRTGTR